MRTGCVHEIPLGFVLTGVAGFHLDDNVCLNEPAVGTGGPPESVFPF